MRMQWRSNIDKTREIIKCTIFTISSQRKKVFFIIWLSHIFILFSFQCQPVSSPLLLCTFLVEIATFYTSIWSSNTNEISIRTIKCYAQNCLVQNWTQMCPDLCWHLGCIRNTSFDWFIHQFRQHISEGGKNELRKKKCITE